MGVIPFYNIYWNHAVPLFDNNILTMVSILIGKLTNYAEPGFISPSVIYMLKTKYLMDIEHFIQWCYHIQALSILNNSNETLFSYYAKLSDLIWHSLISVSNSSTVVELINRPITLSNVLQKTSDVPSVPFSFVHIILEKPTVNYMLLNVTLFHGRNTKYQTSIVSINNIFTYLVTLSVIRGSSGIMGAP